MQVLNDNQIAGGGMDRQQTRLPGVFAGMDVFGSSIEMENKTIVCFRRQETFGYDSGLGASSVYKKEFSANGDREVNYVADLEFLPPVSGISFAATVVNLLFLGATKM